jgi:predicted transcriptional regulator
MKRTTIFISETLERDLQLYARRTGRPSASVVREAIAVFISREASPVALPSFAGAFDSGRTDTADSHEELLFDGLTPHTRPRPRPKRRVPRKPRRLPRAR